MTGLAVVPPASADAVAPIAIGRVDRRILVMGDPATGALGTGRR
jgi:hypothetical protein